MKKKYIKFSKMENEDRWLIINEKEDDCFGQIYYYDKWKKWIVEFNPSGIIWDSICLQKVINFLDDLTKNPTNR